MLIRKSERTARQGRLTAALSGGSTGGVDRRAFLRRSGLAAGALAAVGTLPLTTVRKAEAAQAGPLDLRRDHPQERLHALLGRLHRDWPKCRTASGSARSRAWDSPINRGSHCAKGASVRELVSGERRLKYPMKLVERQMDPHQVGPGHQRDRRQDFGDPPEVGRRRGLLARLGQDDQRGRLSVPQVRRVLGHQQHRPPGAHLPFDDRHRRGQYLGLRRDDQQLHRHPQRQDPGHHGRQSGGSASGVAAASARRCRTAEGERDRHRSAPDAHGGARHRIRAAAAGHRHSRAVRDHVAHHQERLGRQGIHQAARLRLRGRAQGNGEVDAGGGRARLRRAGRAARARRQGLRHAEAVDPDLVHGPDPAHGRHRQRARELHAAAAHRQCRRRRHGRQHLPRPRQRAGRDRRRPRYRDAAVLLRPRRRRVEALVARLGGRLQLSASAASTRRR